MIRTIRFVQVHTSSSDDPRFEGRTMGADTPKHLDGYVPDLPSSTPQGRLRSWGFQMVQVRVLRESVSNDSRYRRQQPNKNRPAKFHLRPIGWLVPIAAPDNRSLNKPMVLSQANEVDKQNAKWRQPGNAIPLRPVQSGESYRITSPQEHGLVRPELAEAMETIFERFARQQGFSATQPLEISLSRGYKANSHGHKEGRAADIAAMGGKSLLQWKQEWERAMSGQGQQPDVIPTEQRRNLGFALYKALQAHGGWRVNPGGWRVYRNVMQLFGPWTATEGPWKAMQIENPTPEERQRLADQRWVFQAHQDHIHVAR